MEDTYLRPDTFTLESAGIDWLTATCYRTSGRVAFDALGKDLIAEQARHGLELRTWKSGGYHGQVCGGVMFGARHDTWICKLSSDVERERWQDLRAEATNITRADVQLTIRLKQANINYFAQQRERAEAARGKRGRRANVTFITSTLDGDSLYLGKRTSDLFARVYDKGREQRTEPRGLLIRQEVEAKGEAVDPLLKQLEQASSVELEAARVVSLYMEARKIQTIPNEVGFVWAARGNSTRPDAGLRWMRSAVAPTVQRMASCGRLIEVLEALGISDRVTINDAENSDSSLEEN
jgi:DNA relaxase NicK